MSYKIVRFYFSKPNRVMRRGLTLEEAQDHCKSSETSSQTCTSPKNKALTKRNGLWFDGYEKE